MSYLTNPLESATRKKIDLILSNLGWNIDESSKLCNVFTERAKTTEQNKKLKSKRPDYVLYKSGTDKPIAIIETKKSSQNLQKALEQAINFYATPLEINIVFVTDGSIVETFDLRDNEELKLDSQTINKFLSEEQLLKFVEFGSSIQSPEKNIYTKRELIKIFSDSNEPLRKEGIREGIERFTEFSNILFLKLISEIEEERETAGEKRILEKIYCWESFCNLEPKMMLHYINNTVLPRLVGKYNHSGEVFQKQLLIKKFETLRNIVNKLSSLRLLDADSDIKGDAFEYFLKNSVSVGNDLGEYFTPRHIVKLMVEIVDPKFGDTVYDPACGTGGFLIEAFKHIKNKCKQDSKNLKLLKEKTIFGREISGTTKIAKMNMIIIGDGHNNIKQIDSLEFPVHKEHEIVLTNFPFSQTTDYSSLYGFISKDANPVFLKHVIDALKNQGAAGIIVPEGLLFDEKNSEYIKIRKILLQNCEIIAIIKLHEFVFRPYTGQPTSILIFRRGEQTKKVWFFEVREDGFKKTSSKLGRVPIKENDLSLLRRIWQNKESSANSFEVDLSVIKENNYKLSMDSYKNQEKVSQKSYLLGDICDVIIGGTPSRKEPKFFRGNNTWVKIKDMNGKIYIENSEEKITDEAVQKSNVKLLPKGTLLFSFKLTVGKVAIATKDLYTNEAVAGIIPKSNKILTKYLYYLLPTLNYRTQSAAKGKTLNKKNIEGIIIPSLPTIDVQKKIVKQLDEKEDKKQKLLVEVASISKEQKKLIQTLTSDNET